jgi:hypothetical protein
METLPTPQQYKFIKEPNGRWYIDLPHWTGGKAALEMVEGADTMLDNLAQGANEVKLTVSEQPFDGAAELVLTEDLTGSIGGGMYLLKSYNGQEINHKMWLCSVTNWVFQKLPPVIYFK